MGAESPGATPPRGSATHTIRARGPWSHARDPEATAGRPGGTFQEAENVASRCEGILACVPASWERRFRRAQQPLPWRSAPERGRTWPKNHPSPPPGLLEIRVFPGAVDTTVGSVQERSRVSAWSARGGHLTGCAPPGAGNLQEFSRKSAGVLQGFRQGTGYI
jgi:hypothetical protein